MSPVFVAGAHTDVGKTHVACALLRAAREAGCAADAFKPVMSGFDPARPAESDGGRLLGALGRPLTDAHLDAVSPLRFRAPLAPPLAARRDGVRLRKAALLQLSKSWISRTGAEVALLEGAGGVMSPIADDATNLDLIEALRLPVLLVGGAYLGAVSHTLCALDVLRGRAIRVLRIIVSQSPDPDAPDFLETVELTRRFARPTPVFAAPRTGDAKWAAETLDTLLASPKPSSSRAPLPSRP